MSCARVDDGFEVAEPGLSDVLRQDLRPILRHDLHHYLRQDLREDLRFDLRHGLRNDLRGDLHPILHHDLRHGLRVNLRHDLAPGLHQDLRHTLRHDLRRDRPEARPETRTASRPEASPRAGLAAAPEVRRGSHRRQVAPLHVNNSDAEEWVQCLEAADRRIQVSATRVAPREASPDHYGLCRYLAERPKEAPKRWIVSVALVARVVEKKTDPADYECVFLRSARRRY